MPDDSEEYVKQQADDFLKLVCAPSAIGSEKLRERRLAKALEDIRKGPHSERILHYLDPHNVQCLIPPSNVQATTCLESLFRQ